MNLMRSLLRPGVTLYLLGTAAAAAYTTKPPETNLGEVRECIAREFSENGFDVLSSNAMNFEGYVSGRRGDGPQITVLFSEGHSTRMVLSQTTLMVPSVGDGLGSIETLNSDIWTTCPTGVIVRKQPLKPG